MNDLLQTKKGETIQMPQVPEKGRTFQEVIIIPKDLKLEIKQEDPWYQDPIYFSFFTTIIAILIGYLLSIMTEKRTWQRKKSEQIRERQMTALSSLLATLQDIMETHNNFLSEYKTILTRIEQSGGAVRGAIYGDFRNKIADIVTQLTSRIKELQVESAKLRLLKIEEFMDDLISSCIIDIATMRGNLVDLKSNTDTLASREHFGTIEGMINSLDQKIVSLTGSALESLHE